MSSDAVCSSVSEDAVPELLLGAGLGRHQVLSIIDNQLEQSSNVLEQHVRPEEQRSYTPAPEDQRSESGEGGVSQRAPQSTFESSVMEMMTKMSQRLDDLSARVDSSSRVSTPLPRETTPAPSQPESQRN